jgi:hypothetical protein
MSADPVESPRPSEGSALWADHDQPKKDSMKTPPRIALGALIGWTVAIVALVVTGALVAPHSNDAPDLSSWTEQDYRILAAVLGGFLTWFVGLATIALVTIVVRLGHLTGSESADARQ